MSYIWKAYLTLEIVKQLDKCPKYSWWSKLLFPTHYCVKQNSVSTVVFNIHLFNFPLSTCCGRIMLHSA